MVFVLTLILLPLVLVPSAATVVSYLRRRTLRQSLNCRRQKKRRQLAEAKVGFAARLEPMSEEELRSILDCGTAPELLHRLRDGRLKPDRLLLAFSTAALAADKRLNCVLEFLEPSPQADECAARLGPLAGLPVSLKEDLRVCGHDSCAGCAALVDHPAETDCGPVALLKTLGAVPFARTIVPQSEMSVLSSNPIDGTVRHPTHPGRCPGGSSSGEAALVASGGSPLGFGTDVGGSVRLPAAWCGCVGFKPTHGRLAGLGFTPAVSGQRLVPPTWGPLAPDVATIRLVMAAMCQSGSQQYHMQAEVPPLGWDAAEADFASKPGKLRIGYFTDGGIFEVLPCMRRAVEELRGGLESRGHILVPWNPPSAPYLEIFMRAMFSDGGCRLLNIMEGDEESSAVRYKLATLRSPAWLRWLQAKQAAASGRLSAALWLRSSIGVESVDSLWSLTQELEETRQLFYTAWHESGLDVLICPAGGTPAVHLNPSGSFTGALIHLNMFNTLNCPAGTVPVTKVSRTDVMLAATGGYPIRKSGWHRTLASMHGDDAIGLPVAVQCVALPWRDELCLRLMAEVEAVVAEPDFDTEASIKSSLKKSF